MYSTNSVLVVLKLKHDGIDQMRERNLAVERDMRVRVDPGPIGS